MNKDKTDNPPATQTTQVPEKKTYPAYTVQKPTTTTATQERTFEYKKPTTTEPTNVTNIPKETAGKPTVTGTYSTYQKGSYTSSYTKPEVQKTSVPVTSSTINKTSAPTQEEKPPVMTSTNPVTRTVPPVTTSTTSQLTSSTTRLGTSSSTTSQVEKPPVTSTTTGGVTEVPGIRPTTTTSTIGQGGPPKFSSTTSSALNRPAPTTTYTPVQTTSTTQQQQQQKPAEELKYPPATYERPVVNREGANTAGLSQTGLNTSPATTALTGYSKDLRTSASSMITKSESDKPTTAYTPNPLKNYSPLATQKTAGGVGSGLTPSRTTVTPSKTTVVAGGNKPAINLNNIPRNILTSRNNNRGLMIVNGKTERNQTRDIQANYLGHLLEGVAHYPGPFKFERKAMAEKHGELLGFIQRKLSDANLPIMSRLCFTVLNEYLSNHSTSLFKDTAEQSRETICNEIFQYSDATLSNLTKEYRDYFNMSNDYLIGMGDLAFQDASWEDVLFKSLFLRNTTFNIDSTNVDFVLNYVRNKYAPGDPIHTFSMVKLGFLHEIFETPFFNENNIADIWPLLIYPCLKFNTYLPVSSIIDFFNSLALKIAEGKNSTENSLLALFIALLTGDFDGETFNRVCQNSRHPVFAQVVESYYFTLKASEASFDKNYNMIFLILPSTLSYTSYLLDLGAFDKAKEYLDYLISLRPFYQSLERDNKFLHRIRTIRDLVINHYTIIEEVKEALTQGKFLANKKEEIKQTATQTIQKIQAKGKSLFGFVSNARNALSSFMAAGAEEQEVKKTEQQSTSPTFQQAISPLVTTEHKSIVPNQQRLVTNVPPPSSNKGKPSEEERPPVSFPATVDVGMVEDQGGEKPDSAKLKGAVANPFGNPGAGAKPTTATGIKKIPQNRYVSPF